MAISKLATEFAGLPIIEYDPAVGLLLPTMPRREFRPGRGETFWAITLERDRIVSQSGTAASSKTTTREFPTPEAARAEYGKRIAEKIAEGFAEQPPASGSMREALVAAIRADPDDEASRMAFIDYLSEQGESLPTAAYRLARKDYDEDIVPHIEAFLADPPVCLVQALVIGFWGPQSNSDSRGVVDALVNARGRLPHLRALFLGDIPYTDNEISWTVQGDLTGLLSNFPKLEHFRARGHVVLRTFKHDHLKSLTLEASNLTRDTVRGVGASDLPALEHLELWLGTSEYGADTQPTDLDGVLQGKTMPALRSLALRNSEITDSIAAALARAPVLDRLRVLDLSLGTLGDEGAEALLANPAIARMERLDIHHHYVSPGLVARLKALGIQVDADNPRTAEEEDHRYVAHAE